MFNEDIKKRASENTFFRQVLYTGKHSQLVVMSIPAGSDIGLETHNDVDQIIMIVKGEAEAVVNSETQKIYKHGVLYVPEGARHNITNVGTEDLKLMTVYSPPEHADGTVHKTKDEAEAAEKKV